MAGLSLARMTQALDILKDHPRDSWLILPVQDYAVEIVSDKVLLIILSCADYVKRVVWRQ